MHQIDAFTSRAFGGNPAAVVFVPEFPTDEVLAAIAAENNLSETAFLVRRGVGRYDLRWFTPTVEVELCGHATLASGHAVLREAEPTLDAVRFDTRSGPLIVTREGSELQMDLPSIPPFAADVPGPVVQALGGAPLEVLAIRKVHYADYWLARFPSVSEVDALSPDTRALGALGSNVIATAPADGELDFVSRFFAPASGVDEDPVTGSAHCSLAPFWAERLGRNPLRAEQRSRRGGQLTCTVNNGRVLLRGDCVKVLTGTLHVP